MMKYHIYNGSKFIGWSNFERGDPAMGVVFGRFHPNEHYTEIREIYQAHFEQNGNVLPKIWSQINSLELRAESTEGELISNLVHIVDPTGEFEGEVPQVEVTCSSAEVYRMHFLRHIEIYESSFGSENS